MTGKAMKDVMSPKNAIAFLGEFGVLMRAREQSARTDGPPAHSSAGSLAIT